QTELQYEGARRQANTEVRTLHQQAELLSSELQARESAVKMSDESYQTHQRDYRFGLVTNLEVLDALNLTIDARRERDRSYYSFWTKLASHELAAVTVEADPARKDTRQ